MLEFKIKTKVWKYQGTAGWFFASVPKKTTADLKKLLKGSAKPWGSYKVKVKIGNTTWSTSLFSDTKSKSLLLPIKKEIRKKEGIIEDQIVEIRFTFLNL
ncbi:MAG: DUF1905 domain-containing protein [Bacteriovoracaceae bacterium]